MANKKMKWLSVATLACAATLCAGFGAANVTANAAEDMSTFAITAAAIRLGDGTTDNPNGLRFKVDCPTTDVENCYTVISFTYADETYNLTADTKVWRPDQSGWNAVLLNMPADAFMIDVTATAYATVNDQEYTATATSSVAKTAVGTTFNPADDNYAEKVAAFNAFVGQAVTSIEMQTTASVVAGSDVTLVATTAPQANFNLVWSSSDKNVATVENGVVTAVAEGEATITASMGAVSATCVVTVEAPVEYEDPVTKKYVFADYPAGTQYAKNEEHKLDDYVTMITSDAHFTSELRIYSSSTNNGVAIVKCDGVVTGLEFNAGNKVDTLNVYGSNDNGETWALIQSVSITDTSYKDYTVAFGGASYQYLKLDVEGTQQVRLKSMTLTYKALLVEDSVKAGWKAEELAATTLNTAVEALVVTQSVEEACTITLPVSTTQGVTVTWTLEENANATLSGNTLSLTLPEKGAQNVRVNLTATVTAEVEATVGTATANATATVEKDFTVVIIAPVDDTQQTVTKTITFNLGANGTASHADGTSNSTYSETVSGYKLSITGGTNMYTGARDAKGNSCIKFGASSKAGSCTIAVPEGVTEVTFYVAKYKKASNNATVKIDGTATTLTKASDNGEYDVITVKIAGQTSISFAVSSGYRAMLNQIDFTVVE